MPLTILNPRGPSGPADVIRLFDKTQGRWCEHVAEPQPLDGGTAYVNASLSQVRNANNVREVALSDGGDPQSLFDEVEACFAEQSSTCLMWTINLAASAQRTSPITELLQARGFVPDAVQIYALERSPAGPIAEVGGLRIIPARASFRHARQIMDSYAMEFWREPQLAEAAMLHLDDPHYDALLALRDDQAVGYVGVLAVGEVGRIEQVYVMPGHRNQGIGRTMMSRAMEICARSLFRLVMLSVDGHNAPAIHLYGKFGFARAGEIFEYRRGETRTTR